MSGKTVCVTGASGFIASHIVAQLLAKGYTVKATVRDAGDEKKTAHLKKLPGAEKLLQLFSVNLVGEPGRFDACVSGCEAVFHTATPIIMGAKDGKAEILEPAMSSTKELLDAVARAACVKTFILTSSMSAIAPQPEPEVKTEEHWSDDAAQEAKGEGPAPAGAPARRPRSA
jgi:nucleoside-diphosphate-sugar epimerase